MNDFERQLQKASESVQLSSAERNTLRECVAAFMEHTPIRANAKRGREADASSSWALSFLQVRVAVPALALLLIFSGAGVSFAAEGSLPGDILYPVKLQVNEAVVGALARSDAEQASWEARRAERRLEEAETLVARGALDGTARETIAANFEAHAARVAERLENNPQLADAVGVGFRASLEAHSAVLAQLSEIDGNGEEVRALRDDVEQTGARLAFLAPGERAAAAQSFAAPAADAARSRAAFSPEQAEVSLMTLEEDSTSAVRATASAPAVPRAELSEEERGALVRIASIARRELERAREALDDAARKELSASRIERARDALAAVESVLEEGDALTEEGAYQEALASYRTALQSARKIAVFIQAGVRFDADFVSNAPQAFERALIEPEQTLPVETSAGEAENLGVPETEVLRERQEPDADDDVAPTRPQIERR